MTQRWRNWAGNQRTRPIRTVRARDTGDVVDAVRRAAEQGLRVRPLGSGHSFTGIGVPDGVGLTVPADLAGLRCDGALVTVPAGVTLHTLNRWLWARGRALPNLGDIDAQTVAGAISTGTHGTGAGYRGIADAVRGLLLVDGTGTVHTLDATREPDLFDLARVGLGALGVIVEVTLETVPAFHLHARESARPLAEVLDGLDALVAAHDHVEFYWFPHTTTAVLKTDDRTGATAPRRSRAAALVGDELLGNGVFGLVQRVAAVAPPSVPRLNRVMAGQMAAGEYVAPSYAVFCSPRRVRFLEMEYAVPRAALGEAFAGLRAAAARHAADVAFPVEVRVLGGDDIALSTAYGRDTAYLAVHVHARRPHEAYFGAVESVLSALDGRPHWGKLHTRTAEQLRPRYPRFDAFVAARDRLDPEGRFRNPYLDRVLGVPCTSTT
ncbi:FAD-binding protein [Pseudonocardia sp. EV170527-09]|uniref:D-arabinono-1,4-lactone oxidase n=1 Tax=Pseudonocardia sp. EV170527-09 TaxID=2603411 RepID=UPI0011F1EB7E|nr:D-arabinono-1,4-lactone oxidase [Pseudonocardia sp. EV170527-09]KAA1025004.1 FAD-binding protein [Pseudonocardia sp. EV170527-09]